MQKVSGRLLAIAAILTLSVNAAHAATIQVNTRADAVSAVDGRCSLREAIDASNNNVVSGAVAGECAAGQAAPTRDSIVFTVRGAFRPSAANGQLPPLTDGYATIDGWSAPGAVPGQRPRVVLDGNLLGPPFEIGIYIVSDHNLVRGLAIGRFDDFGVYIETAAAHDNWIAGNRIGTNAKGRQPKPNTFGVIVQFGAHDNLVGTNGDGIDDLVEGNLISGNLADGVSFGDYGNRFSGNRIGTNAQGSAALANGGWGIITQTGSSGLVVGTDGDGSAGDAGDGNLISGNLFGGIYVGGIGAHRISGNMIGTDSTGKLAIANPTGINVEAGLADVLIGTDADGVSDVFERNLISGNTGHAVVLYGSNHRVAGNYVGTDISGTLALANDYGVDAPLDASLTNGASVIGGPTAIHRNLISGNTNTNVGFSALDMTVQCNFIGSDITGTVDLTGNTLGLNAILIATNSVISDNRISFNSIGVVSSSPTASFANNIIAGNDDGVNQGDSGTLDAENNWWGDPSGPTDAIGNPAGTGDTANPGPGSIDYVPWLAVEPVLCP